MNTVGILLTGGRSVRFGSPKAFAVNEQGHYFYEQSYQALAAVCDSVVIVTSKELFPRFPASLHVITDLSAFQGMGPLAGIYSGMLELQADRYVVLPCDMPFINKDVLSYIVEAAVDTMICAVQIKEQKHPLVSCWHRAMLVPLYGALVQNQYSVLKLIDTVKATWLDGEMFVDNACHIFRNINRPDQMKVVE
ncbi:MAG TPA: molybdenum cofactor guanylyltransferase [Candidatus Paenibacillus intestinavium]|nr:molybdenum cofactor guanylyltransferase [Candidatus Paenibacillus intestinavium]